MMTTMAAQSSNTSGLTWQQQEMLNSSSHARPQRKAAGMAGSNHRGKGQAAAQQQAEASTSLSSLSLGSDAKNGAGTTRGDRSRTNTASASRGRNQGSTVDAEKQASKSGSATAKLAKQSKHPQGKGGNGAHQQMKATQGQDQSLTWQQLEFNARGKANSDAYSNTRDAETFGRASPSQMHRSEGAGSARSSGAGGNQTDGKKGGKRQQQQNPRLSGGPAAAARVAEQGSVPIMAPSTPDKAAYAGPTFHNSPPASALPQPSFLKRKELGASGGASAGRSPLSSGVVHSYDTPQARFAPQGGDASFSSM